MSGNGYGHMKVTDTEGNVTTSVYDMGDRRTEVSHPASGITTFGNAPNRDCQNSHLIIKVIFKRLSVKAGQESLPSAIFISRSRLSLLARPTKWMRCAFSSGKKSSALVSVRLG